MRRLFSVALIGVALAGASAIAAAQSNGQVQSRQRDTARVWQRDTTTGRRMGRRGPEMAGRAALQGIQLSASQKSSVKAIQKKYGDQLQQLRQANRPQQGQQGQQPNAQLRAQVKSITDNERAEIRSVLTADQQRQFDANVAKLAQRQGKGRGHGGSGR